MAKIQDVYPQYSQTANIDHLRKTEYAYLDEQGHTYLDYTGSSLASRSQHRAHQERLASTTFGNPHSINPTSQSSTDAVEETRKRVLEFLNASPDEYTVIFTPNASGAARLIAESYPFKRGAEFVQTADNHNSINGIREFAHRGKARLVTIPMQRPSLRIDTAAVAKYLSQKRGLFGRCRAARRGLFAYPAQSNFTGVQHPLEWVPLAQKNGYDVLLDTAAYLPTNRIDLSKVHPEFIIASWYKVFGFPTGVGCLVAKKDALARLVRPWFSGGTVQIVSTEKKARWHALVTGPGAFEDGTVNFLSIPDVHTGLDWITSVGVDQIHNRVECLTGWTLDRLQSLRHSDGSAMIHIYGPTDNVSRGGTICFNILDAQRSIVDDRIIDAESAAAGISLRTGCFCNPGAAEAAFDVDFRQLVPRLKKLSPLDGNLLSHFDDIIRAVRVSFGLASTSEDVDKLMSFLETFKDRATSTRGLSPR